MRNKSPGSWGQDGGIGNGAWLDMGAAIALGH